jgi:5-methylthioadenosine/S-adenosylhomocysteine deaminase
MASAASPPAYFLRNVLIPDDALDGGYGYRTVDVTLAGGLITALCAAGEGVMPEGECVTLDCTDKMLLPGSVNAHTHTSEHWARGLIKPLPLELWIHQLVRRAAPLLALA